MRKTIFQKIFTYSIRAEFFVENAGIFENTGLEYQKQPKFVKKQCSKAKYGKSLKAKTIFA